MIKKVIQVRVDKPGVAGFTLAELLVVAAVIGLLVAVQLPAMCRAKPPVHLLQCLNNCRQMGQSVLLYRSDYNDAYPYGNRLGGGGTGAGNVIDPTGWPMQLLGYSGGYQAAQPKGYLCPSETGFAENWELQVHYQSNRMLLSDSVSTDGPIYGAQVRTPAIYWVLIEKAPYDFLSVRPGALANPFLAAWNVPPGYSQYRRHSGGMTAAAADGHADWLRTPAYRPNQPPPTTFGELGDCANGRNPASTWLDAPREAKLFCRYMQSGF